MELDKAKIISVVESRKNEFSRFGVLKLGLFGSFLKKKHKRTSDVDVLVEFKPNEKTADNFLDLAFYLEDLFKRKVDLLTWESMGSAMRRRILSEVQYFRI